MQVDIDYLQWPDTLIHQVEFNNAIFESLSPSSEDIFIRRMENAFPGFTDKCLPNIFGGSIGCVPVFHDILDQYPLEDLEERANAFSYTTTVPEASKFVVFKPKHAPSDLPIEDKYIHISPVESLDIDGIRCKNSGRLEKYEPRIYLRPLSTMTDITETPAEMYSCLMRTCKTMATMFNVRYMKLGKIDAPESYYVYLVTLPNNYPRYKDPSYDKPSIYVENNIPASHVKKIGYLEQPYPKD